MHMYVCKWYSFTGGFLEVGIEMWAAWDLNTQPLSSIQML